MNVGRATVAERISLRPNPLGAVSQFPLEWLACAGVIVIAAFWAARVHFSLSYSWPEPLLVCGLGAFAIAARLLKADRRLSLGAEYLSLTFAMTIAFCVLSYLSWTTPFRTVDAQLLWADRALEFDWIRWYDAVRSHPAVIPAVCFLYNCALYEGIYFIALFALIGDGIRLREVLWIGFVASAATVLISAFMPAFGASETLRLESVAGYMPDVRRLRSGTNLRFALSQLNGVTTFPSFHTTTAIMYMYAFRNTGLIAIIAVVLNVLMLPTIPVVGEHYLIDMLAGAGVAVASILLVRFVMHRTPASSALAGMSLR